MDFYIDAFILKTNSGDFTFQGLPYVLHVEKDYTLTVTLTLTFDGQQFIAPSDPLFIVGPRRIEWEPT